MVCSARMLCSLTLRTRKAKPVHVRMQHVRTQHVRTQHVRMHVRMHERVHVRMHGYMHSQDALLSVAEDSRETKPVVLKMAIDKLTCQVGVGGRGRG